MGKVEKSGIPPASRRPSGAIFPEPVAFVQETLGETPYDKQVEILKAVAAERRVSLVGCNGSGKDWAAARAVLWWVHSRCPAKAIVTGPTTRQVDDIVWNEIRVCLHPGLGGARRPHVPYVPLRDRRTELRPGLRY